jgi:hypothetical protein
MTEGLDSQFSKIQLEQRSVVSNNEIHRSVLSALRTIPGWMDVRHKAEKCQAFRGKIRQAHTK